MILLLGTSLTAALCLLMLLTGYALAGCLHWETRLARLAAASLAGLGWLVFGASVVGAIWPLRGIASLVLWLPALATLAMPQTRRILARDAAALVRNPNFYAAGAGMFLFWGCLLLPFLVYPDLVFYEGTSNHDNFFWCAGAEYLQQHSYLTPAGSSSQHPLYNTVDAIIGWHPGWGRMGAEGLLALISSSLFSAPVQTYNFVVCALVLPWLLTALALARQFNPGRLNRWLLIIACFTQPLLAFFVANGNLPNLLGTLFSGGTWLFALLLGKSSPGRRWPLVASTALCVHGMICSYPEVTPFALLPVGLLSLWHLHQGRRRVTGWLIGAIGLGGLINPLTAARAWAGFWNSFVTAREDSAWANLFAPLELAEYLPGLVTLSVPAVRNYGLIGGSLASAAIILSGLLIGRRNPRRWLLLLSLASFFLLLLYTVATSFSYGWQKSAQFSGLPLATIFPMLLALRLQETGGDAPRWRWLARLSLAGVLGVLAHGTLAHTAENMKWSSRKGLTAPMLALQNRAAEDFSGQTVFVDGATFNAPFFHSMWAARLFPRNPLIFAGREKEPGGYLRDSIIVAPAAAQGAGLHYVATDWAEAFEPPARALAGDRVGSLLRHHNVVSELRGFYPGNGVPEWAESAFGLTIHPYADQVLEFTLRPGIPIPDDCRLEVEVVTAGGTDRLSFTPDSSSRFVARVPVTGGTANRITMTAVPALTVPPDAKERIFPFKLLRSRAALVPARLAANGGTIDFSEQGNSHRYRLVNFAHPKGDSTWTRDAYSLIEFRPGPAEHDVELFLSATPFLAKGVVDLQPTELRFNGELVFAAPFTEPGVLRARILREKWNARPTASIQLHLPYARRVHASSASDIDYGLSVNRLETKAATTPRP